MRTIINLNRKWAFSKEAETVPTAMPEKWYWVNLPHTWNAIDGQDGGGDYYRGTCYYAKTIDKIDLPESERYFLEVNGANHTATVYWNGQKMGFHQGGYSTWRVDVTDVMASSNFIVFEVDNSIVDNVYPQHADFTFYGGLYRDVNLVCVPESHFEVEYYGTPGIKVTPIVDGDNANVEVEVWTRNAEGKALTYTITDAEGAVVAETTSDHTKANFVIENVHSGRPGRIPTCTPPLSSWRTAIPFPPGLAAVATSSIPTTDSSSTAKNTPCGVWPATRTVWVWATHCCPSIMQRMWT